MRRFCIIASGRTGSNFLLSLLQQVPGVVCHGEVFHHDKVYVTRDVDGLVSTRLEDRDRDPVGYLRGLEAASAERIPEIRAFGFKLFPIHSETILRHVIAEPDYRLIILARRNLLAQFSSSELAREAGRWRLRPGEERPPIRVRFEEREFLRFMRRTEASYRRVLDGVRLAGSPSFPLDYLEIKDEDTFRALVEFVGIGFDGDFDRMVADSWIRKQNSPNIPERFSNPDDVIASMSRLGREEWLLDGTPEAVGAGADRRATGDV